jgi:hypothetical protein
MVPPQRSTIRRQKYSRGRLVPMLPVLDELLKERSHHILRHETPLVVNGDQDALPSLFMPTVTTVPLGCAGWHFPPG